MESKLADLRAPECTLPSRADALHALATVRETPAVIFSLDRPEREDGIRIQGDAAALAILGRAMLQPGDAPVEIDPRPFQVQDLAHATAGSQGKAHDRAQMRR